MRKLFVPLRYPGGHIYTPKFLGEYSSSQRTELCCQHTATLGYFFCQDINKKLSAEDSACWGLRSSGLPEAGLVTA